MRKRGALRRFWHRKAWNGIESIFFFSFAHLEAELVTCNLFTWLQPYRLLTVFGSTRTKASQNESKHYFQNKLDPNSSYKPPHTILVQNLRAVVIPDQWIH